jgi:hypothetical protein
MVNPLLLGPLAFTPNPDGQTTEPRSAENIFSTNNQVVEAFTDINTAKTNSSTTYQATTADFEKNKLNSVNIVDSIQQLNDTTNKLIEVYGEKYVNEALKEIIEEHPDFDSLSQEQKEHIIKSKFTTKELSFVDYFKMKLFIG